MKAYGVPRHSDLAYPDLADCHRFAIAGYRHRTKARTRRYWKRCARAAAKATIRQEVRYEP